MRIKFDRMYKYFFYFNIHVHNSKKKIIIIFAVIKLIRFFDVMKMIFDFHV